MSRRNPEGRGFPGDLLCRAARPWGPATGFASLRASHPGKPPSRPRGAYSEVPSPDPLEERRGRATGNEGDRLETSAPRDHLGGTHRRRRRIVAAFHDDIGMTLEDER